MGPAGVDSDDDYENVDLSDFDLDTSDDSDFEDSEKLQIDNTPASTPPSASSISTTTAHRSQKTLKCPWEGCAKSFNRQARLKEHLRSHTNTRPFKCPHSPCTKAFLRDSHLKHHVKSQHEKLRDHPCTYEGCDKSFVTATRLRRHIETHQGRDRFRCTYSGCDQTFRKQGTLDRHVLSFHQNIKPFPCQETDLITNQPCTKAYDTAEKLRTHQRAKHDPTRFSCDDCKCLNAINRENDETFVPTTDSFATYGQLQEHIKLMHPPTCSSCLSSFTTNKELVRHLELVHGVLPENGGRSAANFPCTVPTCNKVFTKRGNLNVHVKTVHENRRDFVCGQTEVSLPSVLEGEGEDKVIGGCGRNFSSKASLEEHVRTRHLGLESKRTTREKKRKASQSVDTANENLLPRKRKPRKDKGVKKISAMESLVGVPAKQENTLYYGHEDPDAMSDAGDVDNDVPSDDDELLSSSMTMLGNQIYHYGNTFHYESGEYPTSNPPNSLATSANANGLDDLPTLGGNETGIPSEDHVTYTDYLVDEQLNGAFQQHTLAAPLWAYQLD